MKLQFRTKISRRNAHDLIQLVAKNGNHYHGMRLTSDADVKRAFQSSGYSYEQVVEDCRDFKNRVPIFENLLGSTWTVGEGAQLSRIDAATGKEDLKVTGPGTFTGAAYWGIFEQARHSLERAVELGSYADLQSAAASGIATIEAYITYRAEVWNSSHPDAKLIDSKDHKVSFDDKIDTWIPLMLNGTKLNKSGIEWAHYRQLRGIRDNVLIHSKQSGYSISFEDLAEAANKFRAGIAGLLVQLDLLFAEKVPSIIIRSSFLPDVELSQ